ncbi:MAG: ATPase, T2SS/T4P/T4SS family [Actinomycetota bacterium]
MKESRKQLGDLLVAQGVIKQEQLDEALKTQKESGEPLGRVLVKRGLVTEADLLRILANQLGLDYVDLNEYKIDLSAVSLIPERIAKKNVVLPIGFEDDKLIVAVANPTDVFIFDDLRMMTGFEVRPVVSTKEDILASISRYARADQLVGEGLDELTREVAGEAEEEESIAAAIDEAPIVKLANLIINQAINDRASDIHIEPQEKDVRVRYRIDGVLHEIMTPPKRVQAGLISRIKIMSDLNIAENRVPQDGRIGLNVAGRAVDLRVATLPTVYGEKIVMRILEKESIMIDLKDLGFLPDTLERYQRSFKKPYGAILITGPTGSGKTTSLYAALNVLNTIEKKIITVEDPVEYKLPGVIQVQINARVGLTFAAALRSILRNDPDIVMIGEIRDRETALISVESALTGHLVLATLHTNDAPQALTRLTEMGIEPFLSASAVDCVVAQRLARKLCKSCKEAYTPDEESLKAAGFPFEKGEKLTFYKAVGCGKCKGSGYKGRLGIYEVMLVSETIEKLSVERASSDEIGRQAVIEGMSTLKDDGYEKVRQGTTSLEEVLRVVA